MIPASHQIEMTKLSDSQYRLLLVNARTTLVNTPDRTLDEEQVLRFLDWALLSPKNGVF
jgi:hypothetical protein